MLFLVALHASAAEVVWLSPVDGEVAAAVGEAAGATRPPLDAAGLRTAAAAWSAEDERAYEQLDSTLQRVREYEKQLDGERVIMADLDPQLAQVEVIRDEADRGRVFAALAYQGFAVERYFAETLGSDPDAERYRFDINTQWVVKPWMDAHAIEPTRPVSAYEIAEAPQRLAYSDATRLFDQALDARLVPTDLPKAAELVVDGRPQEVGLVGTVTLPPGRHFVHILLEGRVAARWDVTLQPGQRLEIAAPITDQIWGNFLRGMRAGGASVPAEILPALSALGGDLWVLEGPDEKGQLRGWRLSSSGAIEELSARRLSAAANRSESSTASLTMSFSAGSGWFYSGDFYAQDPTTPHERSTVNAISPTVAVALAYDLAWLRVGFGLDLMMPTGPHHFALSGSDRIRLRPFPHLILGTRWVQAVVGYVFPYHQGRGLRATIPLAAGFEAVATAQWAGPFAVVDREGTPWDGHDIAVAWGGISYRLGVAGR